MPAFNAPRRLFDQSLTDFEDFSGRDLSSALLSRVGAGEDDPRNLVFQARQAAQAAGGVARGVTARNRSRYGIASPESAALRANLGSALGNIDATNRARIAEDDLQGGLLDSLAGFGVGIHRAGQQALTQFAGIEQDEINRNRLHRAQRRARNVGIGTNVVTSLARFI